MKSTQTLQTLPIDCLLHIFAKLSLPELLVFRTFSRQLKAAVDEHFRCIVTLPVVLSSRASYSDTSYFEVNYRSGFYAIEQSFGDVTYGPPAQPKKCLKMFDDVQIVVEQTSHFRREDFVIVRVARTGLGSFLAFIIKWLPNVTKLAVMIDYDQNMDEIQLILGVYRKQLKVLLLDKTARSSCTSETYDLWSHTFALSREFYTFMESLETLEELYFFAKRETRLRLKDGPNVHGEKFVHKMLRKLKILHFDSANCSPIPSDYLNNVTKAVYTVEEMFCPWPWEAILQNATDILFPALKKLHITSFQIVEKGVWQNVLYSRHAPNLEVLNSRGTFYIGNETMMNLNAFPKLERLICSRFGSPGIYWNDSWLNYPPNDMFVNRTIKHLGINKQAENEIFSAEKMLKSVKLTLKFFPVLETVTIQKPFMKLTIEEVLARQ